VKINFPTIFLVYGYTI